MNLEDLDTYTRLGIARVHLNYWWVKDQAIQLGRLKSCRAMKIMRFESDPIRSVLDAQKRIAKIETSVLREHYQNLKFIAESDRYIKDRSKFTGVDLEYRKGKVIVNCDRPQATRNFTLRILSQASNLPEEGRKLFLLRDGPTRFSFSYIGIRKFSNEAEKLETDYAEIKGFLKKLKNTIDLVNRIAPLIPGIENYYYFDRNKHNIRIEFRGVPREEVTAAQVLKSAVIITGLPGGENISIPGKVLPKDQIPEQNSPQQELLRFVSTEILARRRV